MRELDMQDEKKKHVLIGYLDKVSKKIDLLADRNGIKEQDSYLNAFRGEARDYGRTKLMPSLFRDSSYVSKEKYLFELLFDYGVISEGKNKNIEKAIEAQHYVSISRMLDITFSVLPALYFACSSKNNMQEDGLIFIFAFPDYYSPNSKYIEKFYTEMLEGNNIAYSKNFKVVSHSYSNERIKAQNGGFIFFQGSEFSPISDIYYETISIKSEDKEDILRELNLLFSINEATIYPEKENKAKLVEQKFKKGRYKEEDLNIDAEIHTYFKRIQYECKMFKKKAGSKFDKTVYLRKLRKEKEDLLTYINQHIPEDSKNQGTEKVTWIKRVEESFKILENV